MHNRVLPTGQIENVIRQNEQKKYAFDIFFPLHRSDSCRDPNRYPVVYPNYIEAFHQFSLFYTKKKNGDVLWQDKHLVPFYILFLATLSVITTAMGAAAMELNVEEAILESAVGAFVGIPASRMLYWCVYLNMNMESFPQEILLNITILLAMNCQFVSGFTGHLILHGDSDTDISLPQAWLMSYFGWLMLVLPISCIEPCVGALFFVNNDLADTAPVQAIPI